MCSLVHLTLLLCLPAAALIFESGVFVCALVLLLFRRPDSLRCVIVMCDVTAKSPPPPSSSSPPPEVSQKQWWNVLFCSPLCFSSAFFSGDKTEAAAAPSSRA